MALWKLPPRSAKFLFREGWRQQQQQQQQQHNQETENSAFQKENHLANIHSVAIV